MQKKNTKWTTKKENSNFGNTEKKIGTVQFEIGNTKNYKEGKTK